jgi:hypothetical protein
MVTNGIGNVNANGHWDEYEWGAGFIWKHPAGLLHTRGIRHNSKQRPLFLTAQMHTDAPAHVPPFKIKINKSQEADTGCLALAIACMARDYAQLAVWPSHMIAVCMCAVSQRQQRCGCWKLQLCGV